MNFDYKINPNSKYVAAVSFGPDSMALLHMLISMNADVTVAHVNYHKRPESDYEEESLRKFCEENGIAIEVLDTKGLKPEKNFQDWARKIRYEFFKNISEKVHAEVLRQRRRNLLLHPCAGSSGKALRQDRYHPGRHPAGGRGHRDREGQREPGRSLPRAGGRHQG